MKSLKDYKLDNISLNIIYGGGLVATTTGGKYRQCDCLDDTN